MASQPDTSPTSHSPTDPTRQRWTAEAGQSGFFHVVNQDSVIVADRCVAEEAQLIAALPLLLNAVRAAVATYGDRLALLDEEREWRPDDEYEDMKGHYTALLKEAKAALTLATGQPDFDPICRFVG